MWSCCQCPVMVCRVEWHRVLWVPLVLDGTSPIEFQAGPVPARVGLISAGDAVDLSSVSAGVSPMWVSTGTTGILVCLAVTGKMPPLSALHTLHRFGFLLMGSDSRAAYIHPVSDKEIGGIC